jgi:hypothetical protein
MISRVFIVGALLAAAACNRTRVSWEPSKVYQVPDGTQVRFTEPRTPLVTSIWYGRAFQWNTMTPRLITARGDTLVIPRGAKFEVLLAEKRGHAAYGAVIGWTAAVISILADCGFERTCGEQNPLPALGLAGGALIGSMIRTDKWVTVSAGRSP